jgi:hypothetical protein
MLDVFLRDKLSAPGRFSFVSIPPELQKEIAAGPGIRNCNACERDFANRIGAEWAAWGTVQKVSNLILNIAKNLSLVSAQNRSRAVVSGVVLASISAPSPKSAIFTAWPSALATSFAAATKSRAFSATSLARRCREE